jgi:hypothetical protein
MSFDYAQDIILSEIEGLCSFHSISYGFTYILPQADTARSQAQ